MCRRLLQGFLIQCSHNLHYENQNARMPKRKTHTDEMKEGKSHETADSVECQCLFYYKNKIQMMTQRVHSRLLTKTKAFYLSFSAFFSFHTLLVLAWKSLGKNVESLICFCKCMLPSQTNRILILAKKKKKKIHTTQPRHLQQLVLSMERIVYKGL